MVVATATIPAKERKKQHQKGGLRIGKKILAYLLLYKEEKIKMCTEKTSTDSLLSSVDCGYGREYLACKRRSEVECVQAGKWRPTTGGKINVMALWARWLRVVKT